MPSSSLRPNLLLLLLSTSSLLPAAEARDTVSTVARDFVETILDGAVPNVDLSAQDKETLSKLLVEDCTFSATVLTDALVDVTNNTNHCRKTTLKYPTEEAPNAHERSEIKSCSTISRRFFEKYKGGTDLLYMPLDKHYRPTIRDCADGKDESLPYAFAQILDRYTPCDLNITTTHIAIFDRILSPPSTASDETRQAGDLRSNSLRAACIALVNFEDMRTNIVDYVSNTVGTMVNQALDFAEQMAR